MAFPRKKPNLFQRLFRRNRNARVENPVTRAALPWDQYQVDRNEFKDINGDFGYPDNISFEQFHNMYRRNPLAYAAINQTMLKCYQSYPVLTHTEDGADETPQEKLVRQHFSRIRFWQHFIEADRRGMVGGFAGLILRIADGRKFDEPVEGGLAGAGVEAIIEVIPAWRGQLTVATFVTQLDDVDYGKPASYQFTEAGLQEGNAEKVQPRAFEVHPDRILIFSRDGTVHCPSDLLPGYNALLDAEKLVGAGSEGFWRNARGAPFFEIDKEINTGEMQRGLGVTPSANNDQFQTVFTERVRNWLKGFTNYLAIKGVKPHFPNVALPSPEYYFKNVAQLFAATFSIPFRVLVGNETGERASTEDAREWSQTCMSRRIEVIIPIIDELIKRLQDWKAIDAADWTVDWIDLTDATAEEKRNTATQMSAMNSQSINSLGEVLFTGDEIREILEMEPLDDNDKIPERFEEEDELAAQAGGKGNQE